MSRIVQCVDKQTILTSIVKSVSSLWVQEFFASFSCRFEAIQRA